VTLLECVLRDHHHDGYGSRHEHKLCGGVSNSLNFEMPLCHEPTPQSAQELPRHAKGRPFGTMRAIPMSGAIYPAGLILSPLSAATIFGRRRLVPPDHDHGNQKPYGENDRRNRIETMARGRMRCECCAGHWRSSLRCRREREWSLSHRRLDQIRSR
jgi:hypothetical protein